MTEEEEEVLVRFERKREKWRRETKRLAEEMRARRIVRQCNNEPPPPEVEEFAEKVDESYS